MDIIFNCPRCKQLPLIDLEKDKWAVVHLCCTKPKMTVLFDKNFETKELAIVAWNDYLRSLLMPPKLLLILERMGHR